MCGSAILYTLSVLFTVLVYRYETLVKQGLVIYILFALGYFPTYRILNGVYCTLNHGLIFV